jgi:hypothetical protein
VTLADVYDLLTLAASFDNRKFDDATVAAWHAVLHDLDPGDAQTAVLQHFSSSREYLMPVHIREAAQAVRRRREHLEREAQQADQRAVESAQRGPTTDRSPEIAAFVAQVRSMLPPGDPGKLRHATKHWQRVQRIREAVQNPDYRPWQLPGDRPAT